MAKILDTQSEYARHVGVAQKTVNKWLREGMIPRRDDGRIDRDAADTALTALGLPKIGGRPTGSGSAGTKDGPGDLTRARTVREVLKAERETLEIQKLKGKYVELEPELRDIESWSRDGRDDVLGLADAHADELAAEANWDPRLAHAFLDRILRAHCERMTAHAFALSRGKAPDDEDEDLADHE